MLIGFTSAGPDGQPAPLLVLAFPWRITLGTFVTVAAALCFRTSSAARETMRAEVATHT
jgi:hypothetical protein